MRLFKTKKRIAAVSLIVVAAATAGGFAAAYWTSTGSGTGQASTGTTTNLVISQISTVSGLTPGSAAQPVTYSIMNPGSGHEYVNQVTTAVADDGSGNTVTPAGASITGCLSTWFTVNNPTQTVGQDIAPSAWYDFTASTTTIQLDNAATNQNACKGVTIKLTFTSN